MKELFKNIFCILYSDSSGFTWMFWMLLFSFILFPLFIWNIIIAIERLKNGNQSFIKLFIPFYILCIFCFYQLVPCVLQYISWASCNVNLMKSAIRLSVFPYQKGAYYCTLANAYLIKKDYKYIQPNYEKAYNYLKGYDFPCWGLAWLHYRSMGQYDTAIEAITGFYKANRNNATINHEINGILSTLYIMKQNYNTALEYANLDITYKQNQNHNFLAISFAKRGFIYKQLPQENLAKKDLKQALALCNGKKEIKKVNDTYYNFRNIELKREAEYQKKVKNS